VHMAERLRLTHDSTVHTKERERCSIPGVCMYASTNSIPRVVPTQPT
jgi:hypothetical protein